jgi:hypothetical protein
MIKRLEQVAALVVAAVVTLARKAAAVSAAETS